MREDMKKVVVDVPRGGSHLPNNKSGMRLRNSTLNRVLTDSDELDLGPGKVSMSIRGKHSGHYGGKDKNARLSPLERFLKSKVGQKWDSVHSELVHGLGQRTMLWGRMTILTQIQNLVELHCYIAVDGQAYTHQHGFGGIKVNGLYVHPKTGILSFQEVKLNRNRELFAFLRKLAKFGLDKENPQNLRIASESIVLEKKDGGWFIHTYTPYLPEDIVFFNWVYNPVSRFSEKVPVYYRDTKFHTGMRRVSTRQAGKKDLRKHKSLIENPPY